MRLTPLDLRKQEFSHKMRGYDPDEVAAFLQMLANQWEELQDENRRREEKIRELGGKLRHYEKVEEALQEALQTARESSRAALQNAEEKAGLMIARAEARADEITRQAEQERHELKRETATLSGRRAEIVSRLRAFLMSEMELLARYEGDDPVGFIRLLPTEERGRRRLPHREEEKQPAEGGPPDGAPAGGAVEAPREASSRERPGYEPLPPEPPLPSESPLPSEPSQPPEPPQPSAPPQAAAPRESAEMPPLDSEPEPASEGGDDADVQRNVPPATESPSSLHQPPEGDPHGHEGLRQVDPERIIDPNEENVLGGPGWTSRTVVSRPSDRRSSEDRSPEDRPSEGSTPAGPPRQADQDEGENAGETRTGASSEEIEKIRRILSGLD